MFDYVAYVAYHLSLCIDIANVEKLDSDSIASVSVSEKLLAEGEDSGKKSPEIGMRVYLCDSVF